MSGAGGTAARLARRSAALVVVALASWAAAAPAAPSADPPSVTIAATRDWGPFTSWTGHSAVVGRSAVVWLTRATLARLHGSAATVLLVGSSAGQHARVAVIENPPPKGGLPAGAHQYTLATSSDVGPGKYTGTLAIGGTATVAVTVLAQDMLIWPLLAVVIGIALGWLLRYLNRDHQVRRARKRNPALPRATFTTTGGHFDPFAVTVLSALVAMFTYLLSHYGAHTFGSVYDYLSAIAAGTVAHIAAHGLNNKGPAG